MRSRARSIAIGLVLTGLAGCDTTPPALTRAQVQAMSDTDELCQLYHTAQDSQTGRSNDTGPPNMATIRNELMRRGATTQAEWNLTDAGKLQTGMHKCIVFAFYGAPVATSVSSGVTRYQFSTGDVLLFQNDLLSSITLHSAH